MDSEGNLYMLKNHPDIDSVVEELDLVLVPDEDVPTVSNMSQKEKKAWYKERKAELV